MTAKKITGSGRDGSLKVRVKTAKKRTISSTLWLQRQLNDPYVLQARKDGWRSRAAYKLIEMDERYHLLKPNQKIVDLGAAPGGWSQVAIKKVGGKGRVIGIDLLDIDPIPGVEFTVILKRGFKTVRHVKPEASRAGSAELYVLATGFKGRAMTAPP
jgi:23S rRNA (uridine2552-2'-O)-methyltransferase